MNKKLLWFIGLICLFSLVNAQLSEDLFSKKDFSDRMNLALSHNREQVSILIATGYFDGPEITPGTIPRETSEEKQKELINQLNRLDELKDQTIKEYNVFYDAYYKADAQTVQEQNIKLKAIFDEMNPLMHTIVKFEGISDNIFYWSIKLEYLIKKGQINPDNPPIDNSSPFTAIKNKTSIELPVIIDDCCISEPDSKCCKEKDQPLNSLIILVTIVLIAIVGALVYFIFIKK